MILTMPPPVNWRFALGFPFGKHIAMDDVREKYFKLIEDANDDTKRDLSAALHRAATELENTSRYHRFEQDGWWTVNDGHVPDPDFAQGYIVAVCRKESHAQAIQALLNYAGGNAMVREELGITV